MTITEALSQLDLLARSESRVTVGWHLPDGTGGVIEGAMLASDARYAVKTINSLNPDASLTIWRHE